MPAPTNTDRNITDLSELLNDRIPSNKIGKSGIKFFFNNKIDIANADKPQISINWLDRMYDMTLAALA